MCKTCEGIGKIVTLDLDKALEENKVSAGLFSYNSEGACVTCKGRGFIETDLSFMDSVETVCEECNGKSYKGEVLEYKFKKEKN